MKNKREIQKIVEEILEKDEYARGNDNYLILKVMQEVEPENVKEEWIKILSVKQCLESITRARREMLNKKHPEWKIEEVEQFRELEEKEYVEVYGHHIPSLF